MAHYLERLFALRNVDPEKRPTANQILKHPWVLGDSATERQIDREIVSHLQSFNARCKFRAGAIGSMYTSTTFLRTKKLKNLVGSYDLNQQELQNLRNHFKTLCADGENATLNDFQEVLKAMKMTSLIPLVGRIFDLFDNNQDGTVDMREILCGFSGLKNFKGDDALRLCFQMYDIDGPVCISREEVASMLRKVSLHATQFEETALQCVTQQMDVIDLEDEAIIAAVLDSIVVTNEHFSAAIHTNNPFAMSH